MRPDLPTGTVTFLFTDVEGSTKLLHKLGAQAYAEALAEHRHVVREVCGEHGGVEVDTQGDAFFLAFPTAPGALKAAQAIAARLESGPIRIRLGLHTGTPLVTEEGYVGPDVHRASRIAASGHGGQVLVSASTAELVDLELRDLGEHRFKDLAAAERVFQVGDSDFPALKSLYRTNLPVPATPFLGRERELEEILALLARPHVRLLTLTGPGGTGKTRLALQAAAEVSDSYPDGVFWVPLAPLRDPESVLVSVAQALDVREQAVGTLTDSLRDAISEKQMLVLLDNLEHLLPDATKHVSALAFIPGPVLLVTSRERLQLQGEHLYPVPTLEERDGIELFLARARALDPGFSSNGTVARLCARLDNLPLALELAAARTTLFSPEQLFARLSQRLDLLKGGRDADPRQQTLRATIDWSYGLLDPDEQGLFRSLSVFAGGCSYEAAEEVCSADPDTMQSLLDKSLLSRRDTELGPRYSMLETIREFAAEQLDAHGEALAEAGSRHADYFATLSDRAWAALDGPEEAAWLASLAVELPNLRRALGWSLAAGGDVAPRVGRVLGSVLRLYGQLEEGRAWLERVAEQLKEEPTVLRADVLGALGALAISQSDFGAAQSALEDAVEIARDVGSRSSEGRWLHFLAFAWRVQADYERARPLLVEAVAAKRQAGELGGAAWSIGSLADQATLEGAFDEATSLYEEGLRLVAEAGNPPRLTIAYEESLAFLARLQGEVERTETLAERALSLAQELGDAYHIGLNLEHLAWVARERGQLSTAIDRARQALEHLWSMGETGTLSEVIELVAALELDQEHTERAATLFGAASALRRRFGESLPPAHEPALAREVAAAAAALGETGFTSAFAAGEAMHAHEAVEIARGRG